MLETGGTHIGVATDHVIESFRNDLWPGYKTGDGHRAGAVDAVPSARGGARGDGRRGVADGRARGRRRRSRPPRISPRRMRPSQKVCIWTPDKDLAQCVAAIASCRSTASRARSATPPACARSSASLRSSFPTISRSSATRADGYPGIPGIGAVTAARLIDQARSIGNVPARRAWATSATLALLFKTLATLRTDAALFDERRRIALARADAGVCRVRGTRRRCTARPTRRAGARQARRDGRQLVERGGRSVTPAERLGPFALAL